MLKMVSNPVYYVRCVGFNIWNTKSINFKQIAKWNSGNGMTIAGENFQILVFMILLEFFSSLS